jgi:hemoglobin
MRPTLYEFAGGADTFLALARAHHARCLADPELNHPFSHEDQHPQHVERLAAYWSEAIGGPPTYTTTMGEHAEVMRIHGCNGPHPELDARTIELFALALDDVPVPEPARGALAAYFDEMVARMAAYDEADADPAAPLLHWSWDGPEDAPGVA